MAKIEKKVWPKYFEAILAGDKTFEIRLADFECRQGDILVLREWDPEKKDYTGRTLEKQITYVVKTKDLPFWSKEEAENTDIKLLALSLRNNLFA